jgi:DMSO/TMAO reductase YedYZ heme-binding membrane subunit
VCFTAFDSCPLSYSLLAENMRGSTRNQKKTYFKLSSASINMRDTNLLANGTWALAIICFMCVIIITPLSLAHSSLEELRRRFGHDA